jgi:hypothetical protein
VVEPGGEDLVGCQVYNQGGELDDFRAGSQLDVLLASGLKVEDKEVLEFVGSLHYYTLSRQLFFIHFLFEFIENPLLHLHLITHLLRQFLDVLG